MMSFNFSGEEAMMKSVGGNMVKVAFDVVKDIDNSESIPNTILKMYIDSQFKRLGIKNIDGIGNMINSIRNR